MKRAKLAKEMFHIPWCEFLYYDETSPSGLRHLTDKHNGQTVKRKKGDVAGSLSIENNYYVYSCVKYGTFMAHRIIWILYHKTDIPHDCIVDHIDGNRANNKIENLRLVKESDNSRNAKMYKNNTTGKVGIYFDIKKFPDKIARHYWKASWIELDGTQKTKAFSIEKFGLLPAQVMASLYRDEQINRLKSQGADYTERHGT